MQGSNRDEALFQLATRYDGSGQPVTAEQYPQILATYFGQSRVAAVQEKYPLSNYSSPLYALSAALTDSGMITNHRIGLCNLHLANQLAAPHGPVYSYEFADGTAPYPAPIFEAPGNFVGAAHTKELSYLFHQNELAPARTSAAENFGHDDPLLDELRGERRSQRGWVASVAGVRARPADGHDVRLRRRQRGRRPLRQIPVQVLGGAGIRISCGTVPYSRLEWP
jgi:carboxylesterase type B